ncbi:DUF1819 family protein [Clostridium sp.]|jgi:hypothetical protein|uniref:DUF1819 family protein n=1 Tax=Clostridium sp. TaxID=1506 RepID=UPI003EEC3B8B
MDKKLEYRSSIKATSFLYIETKKASSLVLKGLKEFEIIDMSINVNIFQMKSERRKKEVASIILKRLKALDEFLLSKLANGDLETSKQIVIYAIMKTDRLFFEFMSEVYRDKIILKEKYIADSDFNVYFERKCEQSDSVAAWKDYTFYKVKQVVTRILFEAGLIKNQKSDKEINIPIIDCDLAQHLKGIGDLIYLEAMLGYIS